MNESIHNPILKGFYPDPSICRVEEDFYMVTSSFAFYPGVPIFHSKDLVHWRQLGHVLNRPSQLPLDHHLLSGGIFAPTLRYHNGVFYMITTNVNHGGNFVVTAEDPAGEWSEPHYIKGAEGIDPSLFWDDDGTAYYMGTSGFGHTHDFVWIAPIDLNTFELTGEKTEMWCGALTGCSAPEAPHIYKKDGWYYLMISEGGTEHYHAVTIARSRCVTGPYKGFEGNPILTHRHLGHDYPICNVGHADLVQTQNGSWYMVALGSRIYGGYHKNMGRETFILPVNWDGEWPEPAPGTGKIEWNYPAPELPPHPFEESGVSENDFRSLVWNTIGTPVNQPVRIEKDSLYIRCIAPGILPLERTGEHINVFTEGPVGATGFYGRRQQHKSFECSVQVQLPDARGASCGLVIVQNGYAQLRTELVQTQSGVMLRAVKGWSYRNEKGITTYCQQVLYSAPYHSTNAAFSIVANEQQFSLLCNGSVLAVENGGFMGSESAGGFVGAYIGLFASGNGVDMQQEAVFTRFCYCGKEE